jgi:hypothetical protein
VPHRARRRRRSGSGESTTAHEHADAGGLLLPERPTEWWRQRVRYDWVRTEVALLDEDTDGALDAADSAVERAERAPRPAARRQEPALPRCRTAPARHGAGPQSLRRAATLAEGLGALPLVWPSRALLGALLMEEDEVGERREPRCRTVRRTHDRGNLPADLRDTWLARPDLAGAARGLRI